MIGGSIKKILELLSRAIDILLGWLLFLVYLGIIPSVSFSLAFARAAIILTDGLLIGVVVGMVTGIISEILWVYFFLYPFPRSKEPDSEEQDAPEAPS